MKNALQRLYGTLSLIPYDFIALLSRFAIAGVFWRSGQTKVKGFTLDLVDLQFDLGWPSLSDSAVALFREEYRLPWVSPELAASLAAFGEHVLPFALLLGFLTRLSAAGPVGHDTHHSIAGLSRRLAYTRDLGRLAPDADRHGPGTNFSRRCAGHRQPGERQECEG